MAFSDVAARAVRALVPTSVLARLSPRNEPANLARTAVASTIQSACSTCESGDPKQLFQLYRDMATSGSHVQNELNKRKLAVLGDTMNIIPADKGKPDDVAAATAVARMIEDCENWLDGLMFLMDSSAIHPVSIAEAIWRPVDRLGEDLGSVVPVYTMRKWAPVNYSLLTFKQPNIGGKLGPEKWEDNVRIYRVDDTGKVVSDINLSETPDPQRHIVHRGHMLIGILDKWGGPGRAVLAWWYLGQLGRDWFGRYMERYGTPFPVGKTNVNDAQAVAMLQEAFATASKIGGLVVSTGTEVELKEAATSGAADAYERFLAVCNREISKVIVGQELSSTAAATGLGSGVAKLQGQVRDDIRIWDQKKLCETICKQLIKRFLFINALPGACPKLVWGSLSTDEAAKIGALLVQLNAAGLQPSDEAIPQLSEKVGFEIERKAEPAAMGGFGEDPTVKQDPKDPKEPAEEDDEKPKEDPMGLSASLRTYSATQSLYALSKGVPASWLNPIAKELKKLEMLASDKSITDEELMSFVELAARRIPELFPKMDVNALGRSLEANMVKEVLDEARHGIRRDRTPTINLTVPPTPAQPITLNMDYKVTGAAPVKSTKVMTPVRDESGSILRYVIEETPNAETTTN